MAFINALYVGTGLCVCDFYWVENTAHANIHMQYSCMDSSTMTFCGEVPLIYGDMSDQHTSL